MRIELFQPESGRRIRAEAPIVFGRSPSLYSYAGKGEREFSPELLDDLSRLAFVEIQNDDYISRTHGLLDPSVPSLRDLNSFNGVRVNGRPIPATNAAGEGPATRLAHGDAIRIGHMTFYVQADQGEETFFGALWSLRHAVIAPRGEAGAELEAFLRERKRFGCVQVATWDELGHQLERLAHAGAKGDGTGITVVALCARPLGSRLELGGEARPATWLIPRLNRVAGSKVLALQAEGDPQGFERIFADAAFHDALLVTSSVPGLRAAVRETVVEELCTEAVAAVRGSRAHDGVLDGLDALIPADTNLLDLAWYRDYEGALTVTCGGFRPPSDDEVGTCYVATARGECSSRRRYRFDGEGSSSAR